MRARAGHRTGGADGRSTPSAKDGGRERGGTLGVTMVTLHQGASLRVSGILSLPPRLAHDRPSQYLLSLEPLSQRQCTVIFERF